MNSMFSSISSELYSVIYIRLFSFSAISIFADTPADISQDAVVTGSISSSANTFTETDTVSVDTYINRPVNSGDFVSYRFDNLAMAILQTEILHCAEPIQ